MSKKEDETYGSGSAAAASVNSSKSSKNSGSSGFSSFSQGNGVQSTGSFQASDEAAKNNANSSVASVSYTSSPNISASGFSSLSSKSTNPSFSQGQSGDGESFGNATSVQSVSVPENASFSPIQLETNQANLSPKDQLLNLRENQNVQKFLGLIRFTEGTARYDDPYATTFGGRTFDTSLNHPGTLFSFKTKSGKNQKTSAHGAYQFLSRTWAEKSKKYGLENMSPENQDVAALALIQDKDALQDVLEGNFDEAISKTGAVWASLPSAPASYDQPKVSNSSIDKYLSTQDVAYNTAGLPENGDIPTPAFDEIDQNAPVSTAMAYTGPELDQNNPFDAVLTEKDTGLGLAALNPSGSVKNRDISSAEIIPVSEYNPRAGRSEMPSSGVVDDFAKSVSRHFGKDYKVAVYSGQEPKGAKPVGSPENHPSGRAADLDIIAPDGTRITGKSPEDAEKLRNVHIDMAVLKHPVGFGEGYMKEGRTHVGGPEHKLGWGKGGSIENLAPDLKADLIRARETGTNWNWNVPIPADRNGDAVEIASIDPLQASPIGNVVRQELKAQTPQNVQNQQTVQTPTQRVDKYTAPPTEATEQEQGLTGKQKFMAGVIDVGSSFIPGAGTAIGIANGVASLTGNKTLGQRLVSGKGFNVNSTSLDSGLNSQQMGQGDSIDYAEIERLRKLEEERLAAEEAEAATQTPTQIIDRYLTTSNDDWRPNASERFGSNANNYR